MDYQHILQVKSVDAVPVADLVLELTEPALELFDGKMRANAKAILRYCPADGGSYGEAEPYAFTAPLGPIEAEKLAWYLERYINWPSGPFQDRAREVEQALPWWGQLLYQALTSEADRTALETWQAVRNADRRFSVLVRPDPPDDSTEEQKADAKEAAALLLSLPWELMHDGECYLFQDMGGVLVRRRLLSRNRQDPFVTELPIRVLLVSPRPEDENATYIDHRISVRPVVEVLSQLGNLAEFKLLTPPTFPALRKQLRRARKENRPYHVVHFDGHGIFNRVLGQGVLYFENPADVHKPKNRRSKPVKADDLAAEIRGHRIPLFFLEACQTSMTERDPTASVAGRLLQSGVASVVAMSHAVLIETTHRFASRFYQELMSGKGVGQATLAGQRHLKSDTWRARRFTGDLHLQDWFVPVLFQEEEDPQLIQEPPVRGEGEKIGKDRALQLGKIPDEPAHTFVGRSRELLHAERLLAQKRYVVIRGEGGEGKTALAAELVRWLVLTRRFDRGAFVDLEKYGDAHSVLFALGEQLVPDYVRQTGGDDQAGLELGKRQLRDQSTVIILDNMESILPPAPGSEAAAACDPEALKNVLQWCRKLCSAGQTRLVFTSRVPMPEPFARNSITIERLEREDAIALVGNVMGKEKLMPGAHDAGESHEEIEKLVDAVHCHARSLVLLTREVAERGVRHATDNLHELMAALHKRYPRDRERSLFASVELSLRRLPGVVRETIKPLAVFQGGARCQALAWALDCQPSEAENLARAIAGVGLGTVVEPSYVRLDPALGPALAGAMTEQEAQTARECWAKAMAKEASALWVEWFQDRVLAASLTSLELPNLMASLEYFSRTRSAEQVIAFAADIENLLFLLDNPKVLARVVGIREETVGKLPWGHERFRAEVVAVDRLLDKGWYHEAKRAARAALRRAKAAGEAAYKGAGNDIALLQFVLGRSLLLAGNASAALPYFKAARKHYEAHRGEHGAAYGADVSLARVGACLAVIGRLSAAAKRCSQVIERAGKRDDQRAMAVGIGHLAGVLARDSRFDGALDYYEQARSIFEDLNDRGSVAKVWHCIGLVHRDARHYDEAEQAFGESYRIKLRLRDKFGEACTLADLGTLFATQGRQDDAERFTLRACEILAVLTAPHNPAHAGDPRLDI